MKSASSRQSPAVKGFFQRRSSAVPRAEFKAKADRAAFRDLLAEDTAPAASAA